MFLSHIAHDVYVCGKTINLLKLCCPRVRGERLPTASPTLPAHLPLARSIVFQPGWGDLNLSPLESFMSGSVEFLVFLQRWEES